jgi:hypothetical protein
MSEYCYPLAIQGRISGNEHKKEKNKLWQTVHAVDIMVPSGTPVYAVADGRIDAKLFGALDAAKKNSKLAGLRINLHGRDDSFYYAHLSSLAVTPGDLVKKGALLGYTGSAGGKDHLHFAVRRADPRSFLGQAAPPPSTAIRKVTPKKGVSPSKSILPRRGILTRIRTGLAAIPKAGQVKKKGSWAKVVPPKSAPSTARTKPGKSATKLKRAILGHPPVHRAFTPVRRPVQSHQLPRPRR